MVIAESPYQDPVLIGLVSIVYEVLLGYGIESCDVEFIFWLDGGKRFVVVILVISTRGCSRMRIWTSVLTKTMMRDLKNMKKAMSFIISSFQSVRPLKRVMRWLMNQVENLYFSVQ